MVSIFGITFANSTPKSNFYDFKKINHSGIIDKGKFSVFSTAVKTAGAKSARSKFKSQAKKVDDFLKDWKKLELAERIVQGLKGNQNMSKADAAEAREALKKVGDRFYSYVVLGISPKKTEEDFEFPYTVITN